MEFEPSEKVLYLVQFFVDLLVAYVAHHSAPRLPATGHLRKYLDPAIVVCFAFPLQFVVYHSYVAARPWYILATLVLILLLCAGGWLCYRIYSAKSPSKLKKGEQIPTYPRGRNWAWRLLWSIAAAYSLFASLWIYWQFQPSQQATIIVARLAGPNPDHALTDAVIADLRSATEPSDNIQIVPARISVTAEEGPDAASAIGKPLIGRRNEATFVWWGWQDESTTNAKIVANVEPIGVTRLLLEAPARAQYNVSSALPIVTHAPFVIPIEQLRQFTFHPHFAHEVRLRSFYVLGVARLLTGDFAMAKNYFDKSYDENSREILPQVLVSRGFADIGLARNLSRTGNANDVKLAKQSLLDAKSDCENAVSLREPAGHLCLGQTELELGQFMLANLALAYQQFGPTWSDRLVEDDAVFNVNEAIQECSRAIDLLPKSTVPYGCRAHGNFILGLREAGFRPEHPPNLVSKTYYGRAIDDWSYVVSTNRKDFDAFQRRGLAFLMLDDYANAESDFTESIKLDSSYAGRFFWRGVARGKMNQLKEAASDFEAATDLAPNFAPAWCALGRSRKFLGEGYPAREALSRCQELSVPGTPLRKEADDLLRDLQ